MMLLAILLQTAPVHIPVCDTPAAAPIGTIVDCAGAIVAPARIIDRMGADLLACEARLKTATDIKALILSVPDRLETSFAATAARIQAESERERAASQALLVEAVVDAATPDAEPAWHAWAIGAGGLVVGALAGWALIEARYELRRE